MEANRSPHWSLTPSAFDRLLTRLASDRVEAGREYERLRRKLFSFFDWRGSSCPDAHADETLDRVARKLDEGETIEALHHYAYGVARRVLFEWERSRVREEAARKELGRVPAPCSEPERERRLICLERCLQELPEDGRALLRGYYPAPGQDDLETRKELAQRLGVAYGTLKTRAHRLRVRLEACLHQCLAAEPPGRTDGASAPHTG